MFGSVETYAGEKGGAAEAESQGCKVQIREREGESQPITCMRR